MKKPTKNSKGSFQVWSYKSLPPREIEKDDNGVPRPRNVPLTVLVSMYLRDEAEIKGSPDESVAKLYVDLVGLELACIKPGFVRYLQTQGVEEPTEIHLNAKVFSEYQDFIAARHGLLELGSSMGSLENFWMWCARNGYVENLERPPLKRLFEVKNQCQVRWQLVRSR